jgi:integrase/recombinase XerD
LKAFYTFLEREEIINENPMRKVRTQFREEKVLPKTIPADIIEKLLTYMYMKEKNESNTKFQMKIIARDISVVELLFATGLRISELCNLKKERFNINDGILCIKGKGAKERYLQIGNPTVLQQMSKYNKLWEQEINNDVYFFYNRNGGRYSEQSARRMIKKYVEEAHIDMHITPHMFRHAFATLLLEEEVDIRYIQKLLGHSSIVTTQIYTEVACKKQMEILRLKHPRNKMMKDVN